MSLGFLWDVSKVSLGFLLGVSGGVSVVSLGSVWGVSEVLLDCLFGVSGGLCGLSWVSMGCL